MRKNNPTKQPGKGIRKKRLGLVEYQSYVPDSITIKSLQVRMTAWIKTDEDLTQSEFNKSISLIRHRIKNYIRVWSNSNRVFCGESIVEVDTPDLAIGNKIKPRQFLRIDVVLFTRPEIKYDKYLVEMVTENMVHRIIDVLDKFEEITFVSNTNYKNPRKEYV